MVGGRSNDEATYLLDHIDFCDCDIRLNPFLYVGERADWLQERLAVGASGVPRTICHPFAAWSMGIPAEGSSRPNGVRRSSHRDSRSLGVCFLSHSSSQPVPPYPSPSFFGQPRAMISPLLSREWTRSRF